MQSVVPSMLILGVVAGFALMLTLRRGWSGDRQHHLRATQGYAILATGLQCLHFAEEYLSGFQTRFPSLFDNEPMPTQFFVLFNVSWILIWILSIRGTSRPYRAWLFPLWFLALAGILNGIAHPLMALYVRDYFPGLISAPILAVACILLLRQLFLITESADPHLQG